MYIKLSIAEILVKIQKKVNEVEWKQKKNAHTFLFQQYVKHKQSMSKVFSQPPRQQNGTCLMFLLI